MNNNITDSITMENINNSDVVGVISNDPNIKVDIKIDNVTDGKFTGIVKTVKKEESEEESEEEEESKESEEEKLCAECDDVMTSIYECAACARDFCTHCSNYGEDATTCCGKRMTFNDSWYCKDCKYKETFGCKLCAGVYHIYETYHKDTPPTKVHKGCMLIAGDTDIICSKCVKTLTATPFPVENPNIIICD